MLDNVHVYNSQLGELIIILNKCYNIETYY